MRREAAELRPLADPSPRSARSRSRSLSDLSRSPDPDLERFNTGLWPGDEPITEKKLHKYYIFVYTQKRGYVLKKYICYYVYVFTIYVAHSKVGTGNCTRTIGT